MEELIIRSIPTDWWELFIKIANAFSNNLNTANLNVFPNHGAIFTSRLSPDHSIEPNYRSIYP